MQSRERQLHLRLHTGGANYLAIRRLPSHVVQQGRLAHTGFVAHHHRPAFTNTHGLDKPVECTTLCVTANQLHRLSHAA
jgi:hypothetical protein